MPSVTSMESLVHRPLLRFTWSDPHSAATGYVVVDRLVCGIATGGLRTRAGCTMAEVEDLAAEMSLKAALYRLPVGGAKGGLDYPADADDVDEVRERFLQAIKPLLDGTWATAGDLGTPQARLDASFTRAGLGSSSMRAALMRSDDPDGNAERVGRLFADVDDGLMMSDLVGGFGVAEAVLEALGPLGLSVRALTAQGRPAPRAVIQGFGAMGGSTALYLHQAGVRVVAIADAAGLVVNTARGLDVPVLLAARGPGGAIDRSVLRGDDEQRPADGWLDVDAEILVPAAVSYVIDESNCDRVRASLVAEAANVPVTAAAEDALVRRGVVVIPDFVANAGAAAWAWWVMFGAVSGPADARRMLTAHVRPVVAALMQAWTGGETSLRVTARTIAQRNLAIGEAQYGGTTPTMPLFTAGSTAASSTAAPSTAAPSTAASSTAASRASSRLAGIA
ncbi:MAG TPA: Glu/Leu/Phe/Val dehydrogenase dimerization domain-containing protein [Nocardioidaceae bacterium]|nr:Glu/Leu/Phe/Val dehydrogenase dimerization domain-containing protein [Nocardioidaceae bacterium]